jgi:hypothetical protein
MDDEGGAGMPDVVAEDLHDDLGVRSDGDYGYSDGEY